MYNHTLFMGVGSVTDLKMNTVSVFIMVFLFAVIFYYIFLQISEIFIESYKHKNLLPGPKGWPVVGCLPYLAGKDARKVLLR